MALDENSSAQELEILQHNLQHLAMQRQTIQFELNEVTNALAEIDKPHEEIYRVIGNVMVRADRETLKKELDERKKLLEMRFQAVEKQEIVLEAKLKEIQQEHLRRMRQKS